MVVVACGSRVSENFLKILLEDDRLPTKMSIIDKQMQQDVFFVNLIPRSVLEIFSAICSTSLATLRDEILTMVQTQIGYIQVRLREARQLPWFLVGGDVLSKPEALRRGLMPAEEMSQKI